MKPPKYGKPDSPGILPENRNGALQFEEEFKESLITGGGPDEAAKLLWEAAPRKEAWAIQELCRRFAPQTDSLRMLHEVTDNETIDYSKLSELQIQQLLILIRNRPDFLLSFSTGRAPTGRPFLVARL